MNVFIFQSEACLDLLVRSLNQIFTPVIESSENRVHKSHRVDDLTKFYKRDENGNFVLRDDKWLEANPFVKSSRIGEVYKPESRSLFEHLSSASRSNPEEGKEEFEYVWPDYSEQGGSPENREFTSSANVTEENSNTTRSNSSTPERNVHFERSALSEDDDDFDDRMPIRARKVQIAAQDYEYGDDYPAMDDDLNPYGHKPRYYVPGDRPLVDLLIKILELFQVGLEATPNYIVPPSKKKGIKSRFKIKFRSLNESDSGSNDE